MRAKRGQQVATPTSPSLSARVRCSQKCVNSCREPVSMHNPPRILIVDDNETNRDLLITRLGIHGFDLLQASDGEEAIEVTKKSLPDLILLDVMMPKMDGIEATKRIKADASLPFTPIILVTAKADTKDVIIGLEAGADEYLTKPVDQT